MTRDSLIWSTAIVIAALASVAGCGARGDFERTADGVIVTPADGPAKRVRVQVMSDRIVHVTAVPGESLDLPPSLMVTATPPATATFKVESNDDAVTLKTPQTTVQVSLATGVVSFRDANGNEILAEHDRGGFEPVVIEGKNFFTIRQQFNPGTDEAFYGLGQHQNAQMNLNGEDVVLAQHNMDVAVPFVVSTRNYGLLWDNYSITRFGDPRPYGLASRDLKVFDADGKEGGFTARYAIDGEVKVTRTEKDVNYQFIKDLTAWPQDLLAEDKSNTTGMRNIAPNQTVVWEGRVETTNPGRHRFRLFASSYFKLFIDDQLALDGWRQNWNAWYHNVDVDMQAGRPVALRLEWTPENGHIALLHNDPLPADDRHSLSFSSDVAHAIDYYYIGGDDLDQVISGYRQLTGKSVMLPRWAYGFWQSRQRYETQDQLLGVVREHRKRGLPLDNIVQDWFYWREDDWGSHRFDPTRFPDPKKMIDDVHGMNARFMISVWPKFYPTTDNYKELDARDFMYHGNIEAGARDWVGKGYSSSFYDPYSEEARKIYWRQVQENLGVLGVDAWWIDASEPDPHSNLDLDELKRRIGPTAMGPAAQFFNSYPLVHTEAVYEGARGARPDTRVFILTRSAYGGQQRNAVAVWSGDIASRWVDLYNQISAGVNFSLSGIPNWSFDIGGFALESRYQKPNAADLAEWRELNLRWFQFGAFAPIFRAHGEFPFREIYNLAPAGSEVYESLGWYDRLRYRLMPYIYTLAADTYHRDSTMMRGMVMDFPQDLTARNVNDQYLFGPAFLVSPVYEYGARERQVYLPAGVRWYDFYNGAAHEGGRTITAAAPLAQMPLFVKAGSIVPIGPAIEYTGQKPDAPITVLVYTGRNGEFDLYEDDGVTYGYERGAFSRIPFRYDEAAGRLNIGRRSGEFPGLVAQRTFNVRWITADNARPLDFDARPDHSVEYSGEEVVIERTRTCAAGALDKRHAETDVTATKSDYPRARGGSAGMLHHLPEDWRQATLLGRLQTPEGPVPILVRGGRAFDIATQGPTTTDIAAQWREDVDIGGTELGDPGSLGLVPAWDPAAKSARFRLLSPLDLQCIKASGVTFATSAVERVIEERARGDAGRAQSVRDSLKERVGTDIRSVKPGSTQSTLLKEALIADGLWSQYLEVAIGPDAEIFTKAPVLSSVGWGDWIGVRADSAWNNPEPEIVLVCDPTGRAVGATLGNDVNLRDIEGRSALLLGKAKDNNASCAVGPFIRLFDASFTLDHEVGLEIEGEDGFRLTGRSSMSLISRDPLELIEQTVGRDHQYPDGFALFLGTMFAPVEDRDAPGRGFTHKRGDLVSVFSGKLGTLCNKVTTCDTAPPWSVGVSVLMRNLAARGLLDSPGARAGSGS